MPEKRTNVVLMFDGGVSKNPGGVLSIGWHVDVQGGRRLAGDGGRVEVDFEFAHRTNNTAEFLAVRTGLRWLNANTPEGLYGNVAIRGDSQFVIKCISGQSNTSKTHLRPILEECKRELAALRRNSASVSIKWEGRGQNKAADAFSRTDKLADLAFNRAGAVVQKMEPVRVPPPAVTEFVGYAGRQAVLSRLGFQSYAEYLGSDLWRSIRRVVMSGLRFCRSCGEKPHEVHHLSYDEQTMRGLNRDNLIPLCLLCHGLIEFDNGRKVSLEEANERLMELARHLTGGKGKSRRVMDQKAKRPFVLAAVGTPCEIRQKGGGWVRGVVQEEVRCPRYDKDREGRMIVRQKKKPALRFDPKDVKITTAHRQKVVAMFGTDPKAKL